MRLEYLFGAFVLGPEPISSGPKLPPPQNVKPPTTTPEPPAEEPSAKVAAYFPDTAVVHELPAIPPDLDGPPAKFAPYVECDDEHRKELTIQAAMAEIKRIHEHDFTDGEHAKMKALWEQRERIPLDDPRRAEADRIFAEHRDKSVDESMRRIEEISHSTKYSDAQKWDMIDLQDGMIPLDERYKAQHERARELSEIHRHQAQTPNPDYPVK